MSNIFTMDLKDLKNLRDQGGKSAKRGAYPTKTGLNLATRPKTINNPSRAIPVFLLILCAVALFAKFCVVDRLAAANQAEAEAAQAELKLSNMKTLTADYEQVRAEYDRRVFPQMDAAMAGADAMDLLSLMESKLMGHARVENFSVQDPIVSVSLSGVSLEETAKLVKDLESSPLVSSVMVYSADTTGNAVPTPTPPPTPEPTPTPKPTKTPKPKKTPRGQTPAPTLAPTPTPEPTPMEAEVKVTMTITLASAYAGGES